MSGRKKVSIARGRVVAVPKGGHVVVYSSGRRRRPRKLRVLTPEQRAKQRKLSKEHRATWRKRTRDGERASQLMLTLPAAMRAAEQREKQILAALQKIVKLLRK